MPGRARRSDMVARQRHEGALSGIGTVFNGDGTRILTWVHRTRARGTSSACRADTSSTSRARCCPTTIRMSLKSAMGSRLPSRSAASRRLRRCGRTWWTDRRRPPQTSLTCVLEFDPIGCAVRS